MVEITFLATGRRTNIGDNSTFFLNVLKILCFLANSNKTDKQGTHAGPAACIIKRPGGSDRTLQHEELGDTIPCCQRRLRMTAIKVRDSITESLTRQTFEHQEGHFIEENDTFIDWLEKSIRSPVLGNL